MSASYADAQLSFSEVEALKLRLGLERRRTGWEEQRGLYHCGVNVCINALTYESHQGVVQQTFSRHEQRSLLLRLALTAEGFGNSVQALRALSFLRDSAALNDFAERCLTDYSAYDAFIAFSKTFNRDGMYRAMLSSEVFSNPGHYCEEKAFDDYIGKGLETKFKRRLGKWVDTLGCSPRTGFNLGAAAICAYDLRERYDVVIPIADSGLFSGMIFKLIGLQTLPVHCERLPEGGASFRWLGENDKSVLESARVLLIDKDVSTGGTLHAVLRHVASHSPGSLGLCLNHSPDTTPTNIRNVPQTIEEVYYPSKASIASLRPAVDLLEKGL